MFPPRVLAYRPGFAAPKSCSRTLRELLHALARLVILNDLESTLAAHPGELLEQICDVPGVLGTLLIGSDGALLAQALRAEHASRAAAAARRLPLLLEALAAGQHVQSYTLRFSEHRLHLLNLEGAFLGALTELSCDAALLKMSLNIAGKRLTCLVPH